jgi:hypothetical protein
MAKIYKWEINEPAVEEGVEDVLHTVTLKCSYLTGKAIVTIDGTAFDISVRPLSLKGTSQMFRLGEMPALLEFSKKGAPAIVIDGERILGK